MTNFQKVIKYLAIAFAIYLSVTIIGGICAGIAGVFYLFSSREAAAGEMQTYSIEDDVSGLTLKLSGAALQIRTADRFSVESNHKYLSVESRNGELSITETKDLFAASPKGVTVILNIPEGFVFDRVNMETGAGQVKIDRLSADILSLSLGAGEVEIRELTANSRAAIEGGAGEMTIEGGLIHNLDLDMGVGELKLKSRIEGSSRLNFGVGEAELTLVGSREDYKIELDKGICEAKLEGEPMRDDSVYGGGQNRIEIDSGIGEIEIEFSKGKSF